MLDCFYLELLCCLSIRGRAGLNRSRNIWRATVLHATGRRFRKRAARLPSSRTVYQLNDARSRMERKTVSPRPRKPPLVLQNQAILRPGPHIRPISDKREHLSVVNLPLLLLAIKPPPSVYGRHDSMLCDPQRSRATQSYRRRYRTRSRDSAIGRSAPEKGRKGQSSLQ